MGGIHTSLMTSSRFPSLGSASYLDLGVNIEEALEVIRPPPVAMGLREAAIDLQQPLLPQGLDMAVSHIPWAGKCEPQRSTGKAAMFERGERSAHPKGQDRGRF